MGRVLNFLVISSLASMLWGCQQEGETRPGEDMQTQKSVPDVVDFNFHVKPILSDRCFKCHGPDQNTREADLAFHEEEWAFKALGESGDRYAIVPGDPDNSELVRRINSDDPDERMPTPESNLFLTEHEKDILEKWIRQGASWKEHWSLIPPEPPVVPSHEGPGMINAIDQFIYDRLEESGLESSPAASKSALLRRVSFTLTGLPPTLAELDAFNEDTSPEAYERVVDRLLASPAYAERMAQLWMDVARYADSHGYQDDPERFMWPWRDWVIHAMNTNMPYDQFVTWQLAGDMMPDPSLEQIIASGFNRNHKITYEGGSIPEEFRTEYVADRAQTFGTAFLGLTVECARCHDHKYDPISQENFYQLYAFFNNVPEKGLVEPVGLTPEPFIVLTKEDMAESVSFINNLDTMDSVELMVMQEMAEPRTTYILNRGLYDQPLSEVEPSTPERVLDMGDYSPDRTGLAAWLFDADNPLTARVAVNRLWQQVFGNGIVSTSFDFGSQGSLPTHPELLDYLALRYRDGGWNTKDMLKFMVMSGTFLQSSVATREQLEKDPDNLYLARAPRLRLEAEMVRDHFLKVAGLLRDDLGGPSVKPYQPEGLWAETIGGGGDLRTYIQDSGSKLYRRSLYTFWKRTVPPPGMMTFDAATKDLCTIKRQQTNTPLQALILMNDPQILEASRVLAETALTNDMKSVQERIEFMFTRSTSRIPDTRELEILEEFYYEQLKTFEENTDQAEAFLAVGEYQSQWTGSKAELAAHTLIANTIFNLDESISRG